MEYTKGELRCSDCCHWGLKRNKEGEITGEHICNVFNTLHSEWQPVGNCSSFIDRKSAPDLYEALKLILKDHTYSYEDIRYKEAAKALAKAEGKEG